MELTPSLRTQEVLAGPGVDLGSGDFGGSPIPRLPPFIVEETLAGRQRADQPPSRWARAAEGLRRPRRPHRPDSGGTSPAVARARLPPRRSRRSGAHRAATRRRRPRLPLGGARPSDGGRDGQAGSRGGPGGWPSIDLRVRAGRQGEAEEAAARFRDYLAVELDRDRDVRVAGRRDAEPCLVLRWQSTDVPAHRAAPGEAAANRGCPWTSSTAFPPARSGPRSTGASPRASRTSTGRRPGSSPPGLPRNTASWPGLRAERSRREPEGTTYGALLHSYRFFLARQPAQFHPRPGGAAGPCRDPECALARVQLSRLHVAGPRVRGRDDRAPRSSRAWPLPSTPSTSTRRARGRAGPGVRPPRRGRDRLGTGRGRGRARAEPGELRRRGGDRRSSGFSATGSGARSSSGRPSRDNPHYIAHADSTICADPLRRGEFGDAYETALRWRDPTFSGPASSGPAASGTSGGRRTPEARSPTFSERSLTSQSRRAHATSRILNTPRRRSRRRTAWRRRGSPRP